ncbi:MAG: class I SAM-dependent methyltransferase [bacterium]
MADEEKLIRAQIEYYRARAAEYDEWFYRTGRYDRGEEHRCQWNAEVVIVREALSEAQPQGKVLDLACGTGLWTEQLVAQADKLIAVDASPEALEITRRRVADCRIECVEADIFSWQPSERFDFVFFGFWLSHVPETRFEKFWRLIADALIPGGKVFFVDSLLTQESTARDHAELERGGAAQRKLNDGREFEIVKVFYDPPKLQETLQNLGWQGQVTTTSQFFLYGLFTR